MNRSWKIMDGSQYFEEGIAIIRFLNFYLAIKQR